jgi:TolB protein
MRRLLSFAFLLITSSLSSAQFRVEISGVGATQIPVAVATFEGVPTSAVTSDIIRADLARSGPLKPVIAGSASETKAPDFAALRASGADAYAAGSVTALANGSFDVRFALWDVVKGTQLVSQSYVVAARDLRMAAHRIADEIQEKLTGVRGAAATRIAYVVKNGSQYALVVADSDGENAVNALRSNEPIISPAWSPSGAELAYVSFEQRKAIVYVHELASGQRRALANFRGTNSAPAWFRDGSKLVVTLSSTGLAQLHTINRDGSGVSRLTQSSSIDTEAHVGPDGGIYFVSDRAGGPQIYRYVSATEAQRVSFAGSYNVSPAVSPDGKYLAFISRQAGFKLFLKPLGGGDAVGITDTQADEKPTFSPNSRLILYASRQGGRDILMSTSLDGLVKAKLSANAGDIREPAWGPYVK